MVKPNLIAFTVLATSVLGAQAFAADYPERPRFQVPTGLSSDLDRAPNEISFDKRGHGGTARIRADGSGLVLNGLAYGHGSHTTLKMQGEDLKVQHLQVGSSASNATYSGVDSEIHNFVPPCATGRPRRIHALGELIVDVESCR